MTAAISTSFRIGLVSDAHGNLVALEAALADARRFAPDVVAHVGDMVNGPSSAGVLDLLLATQVTGVLGNHEDYVLRCEDPDAPTIWGSDRFAPARWTRRSLSARHLKVIGTWPITHRPHPDVTLVHGTTRSLREHFRASTPDDEVRALYRDIDAMVIGVGHTHLPLVRTIDSVIYVNVGSTGIALDGEPRASYALLTRRAGSWDVEIRRVPYDTTPVLVAARRDGWLDEGGGVAATMVHEMVTGTPWTMPFLRWWDGSRPQAGSVDAYRAFARIRGVEPLI